MPQRDTERREEKRMRGGGEREGGGEGEERDTTMSFPESGGVIREVV